MSRKDFQLSRMANKKQKTKNKKQKTHLIRVRLQSKPNKAVYDKVGNESSSKGCNWLYVPS